MRSSIVSARLALVAVFISGAFLAPASAGDLLNGQNIGMVGGAVAGGVIGNKVAGKGNKTLGTAVGAVGGGVAGAVVGNMVDRKTTTGSIPGKKGNSLINGRNVGIVGGAVAGGVIGNKVAGKGNKTLGTAAGVVGGGVVGGVVGSALSR